MEDGFTLTLSALRAVSSILITMSSKLPLPLSLVMLLAAREPPRGEDCSLPPPSLPPLLNRVRVLPSTLDWVWGLGRVAGAAERGVPKGVAWDRPPCSAAHHVPCIHWPAPIVKYVSWREMHGAETCIAAGRCTGACKVWAYLAHGRGLWGLVGRGLGCPAGHRGSRIDGASALQRLPFLASPHATGRSTPAVRG